MSYRYNKVRTLLLFKIIAVLSACGIVPATTDDGEPNKRVIYTNSGGSSGGGSGTASVY